MRGPNFVCSLSISCCFVFSLAGSQDFLLRVILINRGHQHEMSKMRVSKSGRCKILQAMRGLAGKTEVVYQDLDRECDFDRRLCKRGRFSS